jgi:hypothetical protein
VLPFSFLSAGSVSPPAKDGAVLRTKIYNLGVVITGLGSITDLVGLAEGVGAMIAQVILISIIGFLQGVRPQVGRRELGCSGFLSVF